MTGASLRQDEKLQNKAALKTFGGLRTEEYSQLDRRVDGR